MECNKKEGKNMKTNTILKAGLAAMMSLSLVGCSSSSTSTATSTATSTSQDAQNIIIAMSPDYPPFDDLTTDGQITGFDYDMGEWLFTWLNENGYNYTHEWKQLSFDTIISSINADQVDLGISGFTYDEKRQVLFSDPYYDSSQVALVTADSDITSIDDLDGKHLGCQLGATGQDVAEGLSDNVEAISDMGIVIESLKSGGLDAVILDIAVAKNYEATGEFKVLDGSLLDEQVYVIAKEGNDELMDAINEAIAAFLASDDYEDLKAKYEID